MKITEDVLRNYDRWVSGRRDWDTLTRGAVRAGLGALLAQAGVTVDTDELAAQPAELPVGARYADLVYATPKGLVVHIEIQQRPDLRMGWRMADYAVRIAGAPLFADVITDLVQIIVQVGGPPMPTRYVFGELTNEVRLVHLPSMPADLLLATPALAPFALIGGDPGLVTPVLDRLASVTDDDLQSTLATLSIHLAGALRGTLVQELRRTTMAHILEDIGVELLLETEIGRDLVANGEQRGLRQGLEQGREQGREEGLRQERQALATRLLGRRFPDAEPERVARTAVRLVADTTRDPWDALDAIEALDA